MENIKKNIKVLVLGMGVCLGFGCAPKKATSDVTKVVANEESYCGTSSSIADGIQLSGTAEYEYLKSELTGLREDPNTNLPYRKPIRRAELRVKNGSGAVVQCGETDDLGHYSVTVSKPGSASIYTVEVNSRGDNNYVRASVLDQSSSKIFYSVSANISLNAGDSAVTVPAILAPARVSSASTFKKMEGGAFHIFDKILQVNEFLRTHTAPVECTLCSAFTVAPKVTIYWSMGFNPASYFGESSGLSFYDSAGSIDPTPSLYILGGVGGDTDVADTDHFDESVIIHEYGHFLEKNFWKTDSPGGIHSGNSMIDPRLAFSEGFANFLPAAVTGGTSYIDTMGSPYGEPTVGVYLNLESEQGSIGAGVRDKIITTSPIGEGIFREVSVSRALYDYIDSNSDLTYGSNGAADSSYETSEFSFAFVWLALTNTSFGLKAPDQRLVSMGHFNRSFYAGLQAVYADNSTVLAMQLAEADSARVGEAQTHDLTAYAQPISISSTSCSRTIRPVKSRPLSGISCTGASDCYQDLFLSSDFYLVHHPGGTMDIKITYSQLNTVDPSDLDLYIYHEAHSLSNAEDLAAFSDHDRLSEIPTSGNESVSSNMPAGVYLVLVNAATTASQAGAGATYELTSGGQSLCNSP